MSEMNDHIEKLPDIVEKKIQLAYGQIREESKNMNNERKKRSVKPGIWIASAATVAAAAVCVTATIPALADNIPFLKRAYEVVTGNYQKDPIAKNNLSEYAATVNKESKSSNADVTMQSIYFDGKDISVEFCLVPQSDILKNNVTNVEANIKADIDGNTLYLSDYRKDLGEDSSALGFVKADDGNFYATTHYTLGENTFASGETCDLNVEITGIYGTDHYKQTWVPDNANAEYMSYEYCRAGGYEPEKTEVLSDTFKFNQKITTKDLIKDYVVNKTDNSYTLKKISVSPFSTDVYVDNLQDGDGVRVLDNNGNELEYYDMSKVQETRFTSPLKDTTSLTVEVYNVNQDNFPAIASFTVDIDGGYREDISNDYSEDSSKIVYTPSQEELDKVCAEKSNENWSRIKDIIKPEKLGTYVETSNDDDTISLAVTGSRVESIDDFLSDIDSDTLNFYKDLHNTDTSNLKMLLVDYKIVNNGSRDIDEYCFMGPEFIPTTFEFNADSYTFNEPDYQSIKDNEGKSSYMYKFKAGEERTITYGYILTEKEAETGYYACVPKAGAEYISDVQEGLLADDVNVLEIN